MSSPKAPSPTAVALHAPGSHRWLLKSEPEAYSIDQLKKDKKTSWDGVRNYQARNFIRDDMKVGDLVLFYHSNAEPSGVAGIGRISKEASPDLTAFDPKDDHFDPKSKKESPAWMSVQVEFVEKFPSVVSLEDLKSNKRLANMLVLKRGQRLSIQPVTVEEFETVCAMGRKG